jgi:NitT/TauT family transport system substrate-binding protein
MPHFRIYFVRLLLLFIGLAVALGGCRDWSSKNLPITIGPDGKKLTKLVLQTDWYAQPEHGGFYQALLKGYYREVGLDVEIAQGGPNIQNVPKVALGDAQIGLNRSDEVAIAIARGIPVIIVGASMQHDPQAIMFHKESGIRTFKDLDRHNVMALPGSAFIPLMERKYAIKISVTPLDFGLSRFLANKQLVQQCFITNEPFYVRKNGADVDTLLLSESGFAPYRVWFTTRQFAEAHPEELRAFTAASIRGWRDYLEGDRTAADQRIGELNRQMVPEFIAFSVDTMKKYHLVAGDPSAGETYGQIRPDRLDQELKQLAEIEMLDRPVTLAEVFDPRFLPPETK